MMRLLPLLSSALVLALSGTSFAQDWNEFSSREDRFTIIFPGRPEISETTWVSQYSAILPARIYSGRQGSGRYMVTVVDYNPIERLLSERSRTLPALDLAVHGPGLAIGRPTYQARRSLLRRSTCSGMARSSIFCPTLPTSSQACSSSSSAMPTSPATMFRSICTLIGS